MSEAAKQLFDRIKAEGISFFETLEVDQIVEDANLDFKETRTRAGSNRLQEDDKRDMNQAIGGFANTSGGLLIWGVKANQENNQGLDKIQGIPGAPDVDMLESLMRNLVYCATEPVVEGVEFLKVYKVETEPPGYLAMYVPMSDGPPVMSVMGNSNRTIFMRAGASFMPMNYTMVADRFGRRPQPKLRLAVMIMPGPHGGNMKLLVENTGRGVAKLIRAQLKINFQWGFMYDSWALPQSLRTGPDGSIDGDARYHEGPSDLVVHPGCMHPIVSFAYSKDHTGFPGFPETIEIDYDVFCDGASHRGNINFPSFELSRKQFLLDRD